MSEKSRGDGILTLKKTLTSSTAREPFSYAGDIVCLFSTKIPDPERSERMNCLAWEGSFFTAST